MRLHSVRVEPYWLFSILDRCSTSFGKRTLRRWLCAPPRLIEDIQARQGMVSALIERPELRNSLIKSLKKLPDLERLLARVHAFSLQHGTNSATHYEDVGRARLGELLD